MSTRLITALDAYAKTPQDPTVAQAALMAVNAATLDDLRLAAREFRVESDVLELLASAEAGARDEVLWAAVAESRTLLAGPTPQSISAAQAAIDRPTEINPENPMALDCQLSLYGPYTAATADEVLRLTTRYLNLDRSNSRAIAYHAKALSRFDSPDAALSFLSTLRHDLTTPGTHATLVQRLDRLESEIRTTPDVETWP
jgi:hypothetical protein